MWPCVSPPSPPFPLSCFSFHSLVPIICHGILWSQWACSCFFGGWVGGVSLYRLSIDFFPSQMYVHSEMYFNFISCGYFWFSHLNLCSAPFPLHFPTLFFIVQWPPFGKEHAYCLSTMCQWLVQKTETPVDELMSNLLIYLVFWMCPF